MGLLGWIRGIFSAPPVWSVNDPRVWSPNPFQSIREARRNGTGYVSREEALTVPVVLRGRNLICSIGTLPLQAVDAFNVVQEHPLLAQPDPNVPRSVTLAQTVEDLIFEAEAWWRITGFGWDGMPASAVRYDPRQVSLTPPPGYDLNLLPSGLATEGVVWMAGQPVPHSEVIRFPSPNPPLLVAGRVAIGRALALDAAAEMYANEPRPMDYFTPTDGVDPVDDDKVEGILAQWRAARRKRSTAYVPAALTYNEVQQPTPADLQLVQLQRQASLDIANLLGIDPEDVGISTTSRTYQNATDRRQDRVNDTYASYMSAITDRLGMPDVTRPGVLVRFVLADFLKSDPKTRSEVQSTYVTMGVMTPEWVARTEGLPPEAVPAAPPAPAGRPIQATVGDPVQQLAAAPQHTFARVTDLSFDADVTTFALDTERRTITGLAVPWNQVGKSKGQRWRFARGSIKWASVGRVKLLRDHDPSTAIGKAIKIEDTDAGLMVTFSVSPGRAGDEALALAADGVLDGLSIGADWHSEHFGPDPKFRGAQLVVQAALREVSLTAVPAFDDSRLTSVRASDDGGNRMNCPTCGAVLEAGVAHTCPTPAVQPDPTPAGQPVTFSADQFAQFMAAHTDAGRNAVVDTLLATPRPTVDPTAGRAVASTQVAEALPYHFSYQHGRHTFDRGPNGYDFSTDVYALVSGSGDQGAEDRVNALISAAFANVDRADTVALNPNTYRPDLWQPQMDYATPLWDMINSGGTDGTPFDIPKFNTSSALVGPATEETEPAAGAFTVTSQTITPTQVWGKVEVTRQAARRGGRPELSGILWDQMLREYFEDREGAVATFLNTLTAAADITVTTGPNPNTNAGKQISAASLEAALSALQFVRGGNRFRAFAAHIDLYQMLSSVTDTAGRPLYPILAPANANGTTANLYSSMNVGGATVVPSWALGATGTAAANSWLFDPAKVRGWASAPERLDWNFGATVQTANIPQLSFVTIGIYGDVAFGNLDIAGVRQVIYDPLA
jgi:HK97 family phage prohead protease